MTSTVSMVTKYGEALELVKWTNDILLPKFFPDIHSILKQISEFKPRDGDVLLCCYPKCGTHWVKALVRRLQLRDIEETQADQFMLERFGFLDVALGQDFARSAMSPRTLFTHFPPTRIPAYFKEGKAKIVLLLRNPKDVAVSFFHYLKTSEMFCNKQDWDEYFISFQAGICPYGQYLDYLKAWETILNDNRNLDIEIFYYEDLKNNGLANVKRLAKHLDYDLDDIELQTLLDECSIKSLKEQDDKLFKELGEENKTLEADKHGESVIYRRGEIGDWKNHFTVAQNEMYDQLLEESLKESIFKFQFE